MVSPAAGSELSSWPLSPQQRRLLRVQAGSSAFRTRLVLHVRGSVRLDAIRVTLGQVVERHEALRTTFVLMPDTNEAMQIVHSTARPRIEEVDLRMIEADQHACIEGLISGDGGGDGPLADCSLMCVTIVVLNERHVALLIAMPALIADHRALRNVAGEIGRIYAALVDKQSEAPDDVAAIQSGAFCQWQYEIFDEPGGIEGVAYWRDRFEALEPAITLPFQRNTRDPPAFRCERCDIELEAGLVRAVRRAAARHQASLEAYLLACWHVLVARLTSRSQTVIGVRFDGRITEELNHTVGLLARYLPISCRLDDDRRFHEVLVATHDALRSAADWQEYGVWRDAGDKTPAPTFHVAFDFDDELSDWRVGRVSFSINSEYSCCEPFTIRLSCAVVRDTVQAQLHFAVDRLDLTTVRDIAQSYLALVRSASEHGSASVGALEILNPAQRHHLVVELNATEVPRSQAANICQWIESQVECTPDRIAVVCGGLQLTYAEFDARAARIAVRLREAGVSPEVRVGLFIENCIEALVGLWAILKAGGTYVPIDPSYPAERVTYMLHDARVCLAVTCRQHFDKLPQGILKICLDDFDYRGNPPRLDPPAIASDNAVYVIYTSGSTGRPKGVVVSHRNLVHSTHARLARYREPIATFLMVSSLAFDSSCAGVFWALCSGGCLLLPEAQRITDPERLCALVAQHRASHLLCVPSLYRHLMSRAASHDMQCLQAAIIAGDSFGRNLVGSHRDRLGGVRLYNEYGVTEASIWSTVGELGGTPGQELDAGRPVANTRIYLLDRWLQPVAKGVAGELCIGGGGVCRGYLYRPELTAEMFLPDPFDAAAGARMYRTGDIARFSLTGDLELLGRHDGQVKLHGHRVEPREIECVLALHPTVGEAVVLEQQSARRASHLVAYVSAAPAAEPLPNELRRFLMGRLPPAMVPASIRVMTPMPLTPHGKVDRDALRRAATDAGTGTYPSVPPRNAVEETLVRIWCEVLAVPTVGIHDHFVELGGDSILSIQVVSRARREGIRLTPNQIFERPTIAELATAADTAPQVRAEQGPVVGPIPLTPVQHWFFEKLPRNPHHFNQAIMLEIDDKIDLDHLQRALDAIVIHHDALRLWFLCTPAGWQQHNAAPQSGVPLMRIDLSRLAGEERAAAIAANAAELQADLDLSRPSLFRAAVFTGSTSECRLLLLISHHLQIDVVSWRILVEDLVRCLGQVQQRMPVAFPPKTTSFMQWAEKVAALGHAGLGERDIAFWSSLANSEPARLKLDCPAGENTEAVSAATSESLSVEETRVLLARARAVSINEALLTGLAMACRRLTGAQSLVVDLEGHGREPVFSDVDVSRTVGWFTTIHPVRLNLASCDTPSAHLAAVQAQLHEVPGKGFGYGIFRYLRDGASAVAAAALRPEIGFNYLGQIDGGLPVGGLLRPTRHAVGATRSPDNQRRHVIEVTATLVARQLEFTLTYSAAQFRASTMRRLADDYAATLRELIACWAEAEQRPEPGEFQLIRSTQQQLDRLAARFKTGREDDAG
jgi:amino acid adenylation domain-containing protein/non-ribosomal peptide synthase protein (TIGR01720 family)